MNCELTHSTIQGYFDGELDAVRAAEFERHLEVCTECQAALDRMEALRHRLRQTDLYARASVELRQRVEGEFDRSLTAGTRARRLLLIPAFAAIAVAAVFWLALFVVRSHNQSEQLTAELIDSHVRSLQPGHLTDVASTDQHTVKPWFDGRLDFIPPVADYSEQGFALVGGRLDVVGGYTVPALVYSRRKHFINLFVWPGREEEPSFQGTGSRQGYNWIMWRSGGMGFCVISDASVADLRELKDLIRP